MVERPGVVGLDAQFGLVLDELDRLGLEQGQRVLMLKAGARQVPGF